MEEIIPNIMTLKQKAGALLPGRYSEVLQVLLQDSDQSRGSENILLSQVHLHVPTAE